MWLSSDPLSTRPIEGSWTFKRNFEGTWTIRASNASGDLLRVIDNSLMQRLLVESDLIRQLWSTRSSNVDSPTRPKPHPSLESNSEIAFMLTEADCRNWLRDCYGPNDGRPHSTVSVETLDAILLFAEQPDLLERYREACRAARKTSKAVDIADQVQASTGTQVSMRATGSASNREGRREGGRKSEERWIRN